MQYNEVDELMKEYIILLNKFQNLGITTTKKDFTSQIGEWLVSELYGGKRAESAIQKFWDIQVNDEKIQVKTHAKASTNKNRWTPLNYSDDANIDTLVIVVFTADYKIKELYKLSWSDALKYVRNHKTRKLVYWNDLLDHKVNLEELSNLEIVNLFLPQH